MSDEMKKAIDFENRLADLLSRVEFVDDPVPRMKAKIAPDPLAQVKERAVTFIGFHEIKDKLYCLVSASQIWTDGFFAKLDAENPGPLGTPKGEQMKMLIPYEEVMMFFEDIKRRHDESVAREGMCF